MDKLNIVGGTPLNGTIYISGAKNAVLPIMCAALLTDKEVVLRNVPKLLDVRSLISLLEHLGATCEFRAGLLRIKTTAIKATTAPYELVRKMRASVLVMGPLVARAGVAHVSMPGGCAIGTRPIDIHLDGLKAMGAEVTLDEGYVTVKAPSGLSGCEYTLPFPSVGGTENLLMAAVFAKGQVVLKNVAHEPEIVNLAEMLNAMGAKIVGAGTDTITIRGVSNLGGCTHSILPDRIETGTYAVAALMTNGKLTLRNTSLSLIQGLTQPLKKAGAIMEEHNGGFSIWRDGPIQPVDVVTEPYPGLATDLQAQFMALMTLAAGTSIIRESIYENRYMHVPELVRMGANIKVQGETAVVRGVPALKGAPVMATDLRASVSLVLAGLAAEGTTTVNRVYHLDRGYEHIEDKLNRCGAHVSRSNGSD